MPYPRQHLYVTFLGDAYSQQEEWQVGLRIDGSALPTPGEMEALAAAFTTLISSQGTALPPGRRFVGVKAALIGTNGRYADGTDAVEYLLPTPLPGSSGNNYPQIALVLSLRTARSRGYASNGRIYLPSGQMPETSNGLITAATASDAATAGAAFIAAVNAVDLGPVAVMSTVGAGRVEQVTGVRVGRVMDTQPRRCNGLPETYSPESPVPS